MISKKGQIAVYVIIAIVIVAGIIILYTFREQIFVKQIPADLQPVFDYYASCIKDEAEAAISLAGSQGGHVDPGDYIPGSTYAPFSSQLNFLGFPVPYWYYISGNGLVKENVPTKSEIADEISSFIEERVNADCNIDEFYARGFSIELGEPSVETTIQDTKIIVDLSANTVVSKGESSARKTSESVEVLSNFGKMYNTATSIYNKEKSDAFLENYSVDVLRTYAPVDGVEISCSGKIWKTREVVDGLKDGLVANVGAIKFKGDYYTSQSKEDSYFIVDLPVEQQVNLIYSKSWPTKVEIFGAEQELMIALPVGTQRGLGVMGFCYAPYHFVYDVSYPVMVQIFDGVEIFQFPVVVVIDNNLPRQGIYSETFVAPEEVDVCQYKTQDLSVGIYDNELNSVDANLSYTCFNQRCDLGSTTDGVFSGKVPACGNGYLIANAEGYSENRQLLSTNEESFADMILDRAYDVSVDLNVGGKPLDGTALVSFVGASIATTALPDGGKITLSEGFYNVTVYVYGSSSLTIPASTKVQCMEVTRTGIAGLFGATEEKCFDIVLPETKVGSALLGGGIGEMYILPSDLEKGKITLDVDSLPVPKSLDDLAGNYDSFDTLGVNLEI